MYSISNLSDRRFASLKKKKKSPLFIYLPKMFSCEQVSSGSSNKNLWEHRFVYKCAWNRTTLIYCSVIRLVWSGKQMTRDIGRVESSSYSVSPCGGWGQGPRSIQPVVIHGQGSHYSPQPP